MSEADSYYRKQADIEDDAKRPDPTPAERESARLAMVEKLSKLGIVVGPRSKPAPVREDVEDPDGTPWETGD